jgi:hypothetical protein
MAKIKLQDQIDSGKKIPAPPAELLNKLKTELIRVQNPGELPPDMLELVRTWWLDRAPYSDIVNTLKKKGYDIYGPTITNWCRKTWPDSIAESVGEETSPDDLLNLAPERQAIELLWRKSLHTIRQIRTDSKNCIVSLNTMASTVGRIAQAQSLLEKLETDRMKAGGDKVKLLETAKEQLKSEIRKIIGNKPKLVDELCDIFDDAAGNATMMN